MSNSKQIRSQTIYDWLEKKVTSKKKELDVTLYEEDCEVLSPNVDADVVRSAKEKYVNASRQGVYKTAIVNVPLLIVYRLD